VIERAERIEQWPLTYRLARDEDLNACAAIWESGITDYQGRLNLPQFPLDLGPLRRLLAHIRSTDPTMFWVAVRGDPVAPHGERVIGFGSAHLRGNVWFLAMLFVDPAEQSRGVGRELLLRTFPNGSEPDPDGPLVLGTATDSAQPISNGLYARYGIVPRLPVFQLVGRPTDGVLPPLPRGLVVSSLDHAAEREVNAIDRAVLGYEHPAEHDYLRAADRLGFVYRDGGGKAVAYGYTSSLGRVGPIAALSADLLPAIAGHVLEAIVPRGASSMRVTGASAPLFAALLRAGLRIEEFPTLLCWTRPFADFSRYVPSSLALI
jgi:GNAT superfamily N-acetyltransferase